MSKHDSSDSYRDGRWDYEGLQVDTRAMDNIEKHLDPLHSHQLKRPRESNEIYLTEKEIRVDDNGNDSPTSTDSAMDSAMDSTMTGTMTSAMGGTTIVPESPMTPAKTKMMDDEIPLPPEPTPRKLCGLRRRTFWILFIVLLVVIIAAAIVGGVVGGMKHSSSGTSALSAPSTPAPAAAIAPTVPTVDGLLRSEDVIDGSPMNVISYVKPGHGDALSKQTFRMYFQSVIGNVKETVSDQLGPWQEASPLFTDAVNNTGLATITYLNGTEQQATIFYIDEAFNLQEKRKKFSDKLAWEQYSLSSQLRLTARGNVTALNNDDQDPVNDWDGYRMAAVYSPIFHDGPQARLFFRQHSLDGSSVIQELIWKQNVDQWMKGHNFTDSWPNSHMAATIDDSNNILRLFFSTGNTTLQEYWIDISVPNAIYAKGLSIPSFLLHNNADIAATSFNGTTYLYRALPSSNNSIHETLITGIPSGTDNQETYNLSSSLVVEPAAVANSGKAVYQPLASAKTNVTGLPTQMFVVWADTLVGMNGSQVEGGYSRMNQISRVGNSTTWPSQIGATNDIPLGTKNSPPWKQGI